MSVLEAVGGTPLVELKNTNPLRDRVRFLGKLEGLNPSGSSRDRLVRAAFADALAAGSLGPDRTVIEASHGATALSLAMACRSLGRSLTLVAPEDTPENRMRLIRRLASEIVLSPAKDGELGANRLARKIAGEDPDRYFYLNRFDNPLSFMVHYQETGPEIWEQTRGELDMIVMGVNTGGQARGITRFLREKTENLKAYGVMPVKGPVPGIHNMTEAHWSGIYDPTILDALLPSTLEQAEKAARDLWEKEGIMAGLSSGAVLHAAVEFASDLPAGSTVVCVFDSRGILDGPMAYMG